MHVLVGVVSVPCNPVFPFSSSQCEGDDETDRDEKNLASISSFLETAMKSQEHLRHLSSAIAHWERAWLVVQQTRLRPVSSPVHSLIHLTLVPPPQDHSSQWLIFLPQSCQQLCLVASMAVGLKLPVLANRALTVLLHLCQWAKLPEVAPLINTALSKRCMLMVGMYGVSHIDPAEEGVWQENSGVETVLEASQLQLKLAMAARNLCLGEVRTHVTFCCSSDRAFIILRWRSVALS